MSTPDLKAVREGRVNPESLRPVQLISALNGALIAALVFGIWYSIPLPMGVPAALADADLKKTAAAIAWSGFYSGGHSCVGTDRVFVESTVETRFLQLLVEESQMIWINDTSFGLPNLPWGGWGEAGWGSIFSQFSLHEAARLKWISTNPAGGRRPWWHPYSEMKMRLARLATLYYRK